MYKSWMWKQRSFREQAQGAEGGAAAGGTATTDDQDQGQQHAEGETLDAEQQAGQVDQQAGDDGEVVITIGDEAPPATNDDEVDGKPAPAWVKELRKENRELKKRQRELEQAETARQAAAAPKAEDVGAEPQLEDFDFEGEPYKKALLDWHERKRAADAKAAAARTEQEAAVTAWNTKLTAYNTAKTALKVDDFDGAEHVVRETLNQTQIGVMLTGADKPELLVYAIGRNPVRAKELAAIKDPVKFAFAVAKLETQLKIAPRATPPAPEKQVRSTAGGATAVDSTEARLEAEADKTGNRTKLIQYRKEKAAKAA